MICETTGVRKSLFMNRKLCPHTIDAETTQVPNVLFLCSQSPQLRWPLLSLLASVHSPAFPALSILLRGNHLSLTLAFSCLHSVGLIPLSHCFSWVAHWFRHNPRTHQDTERIHKTKGHTGEPYGLSGTGSWDGENGIASSLLRTGALNLSNTATLGIQFLTLWWPPTIKKCFRYYFLCFCYCYEL